VFGMTENILYFISLSIMMVDLVFAILDKGNKRVTNFLTHHGGNMFFLFRNYTSFLRSEWKYAIFAFSDFLCFSFPFAFLICHLSLVLLLLLLLCLLCELCVSNQQGKEAFYRPNFDSNFLYCVYVLCVFVFMCYVYLCLCVCVFVCVLN